MKPFRFPTEIGVVRADAAVAGPLGSMSPASKFTRDTLSAVTRRFHCTTCDVDHVCSLDDTLEVAFTVNPAVNTLKLDPYGGPEPGSNGMTLDPDGRVSVAGHARRNVWRLEKLDPNATITVLADSYQGKKLNSPNDLVYRSDGSLYFTDPPYGLPTQGDNDPLKALKVNGVYRIPNARQQKAGAPPERGLLQLVIKDLPRPNGIVFSPDEKTLYIADSGKKQWLSYRVHPNGSVSDGKLLLDASGEKAPGGPDGIRVDKNGNIYGAGPGGVWIISPEGKHLGTIKVPEVVSNVAWGYADGKMLYITASTSLYRIQLTVPGVRN